MTMTQIWYGLMVRLSKDNVRIRRKIFHHITRQLSKQSPDKKAAFESHFKELVHGAITEVLQEEQDGA